MRMKILLTACVFALTLSVAEANPGRVELNIEPQPIRMALKALSVQAGVQVLLRVDDISVDDVMTQKVSGNLTAREALDRLLVNSGLKYEFVDDRTVRIAPVRSPAPTSSSSRDGDNSEWITLARVDQAAQSVEGGARVESNVRPDEPGAESKGIPEILVQGSKILNMDIRRSADDPQPYVIFDRKKIEESGASTIEDFLKNRLTMNSSGATYSQSTPNTVGNMSSINLRGLGATQTLILIDGRRVGSPSTFAANFPSQPDINGIPVSAIERIEVLPTTASGIYGGSATGGVINIVLRRDYSGMEAKFTYDNTFDSDAANRRIDLSAGFNFNEGATNLLLTGSYTEANKLTLGDRDFRQRAVARVMANNPAYFTTAATPPMGATTNIRSVTGENLTLKNGTALGYAFTSVPDGYLGSQTDAGAALVANAGKYNFALSNTAHSDGGAGLALLNSPKIESAGVALRHQFTTRLQAFLEGNASNNIGHASRTTIQSSHVLQSTVAGNPFQQAIRVQVPLGIDDELFSKSTQRRAVTGAIFKLSKEWLLAADYGWTESSFEYRFPRQLSPAGLTAITSGAINVVRDVRVNAPDISPYVVASSAQAPAKSTLGDATLRLSGAVGALRGGPIALSAFVEHREEKFKSFTFANLAPELSYAPPQSQTIDSAYAEARLPLLKPLELQLAVRRDDYSVTSSGGRTSITATPPTRTSETRSTNPTIALRYQPLQDLALRASYGTGFMPPAVNQLLPEGPFVSSNFARDPRRGNESVSGTLYYFGNPNLRPEESENISAGFILTPRVLPALRLSVDYTRTDKTDNITTHPQWIQGMINDESLFGEFVVRGPVPANDPYGVGPITSVTVANLNLAAARVEAFDMQLDYRWETASRGNFDLFMAATRTLHVQKQLLAGLPFVESVGITTANPLKLKANAALTWTAGDVSMGWSTVYFDSYQDSTDPALILAQGNGGQVPSQVYHDLFARYRLSSLFDGRSIWKNFEVQGGVRNVFNTHPPVDVGNISLNRAGYSTHGDPRIMSYYLSLKTSL